MSTIRLEGVSRYYGELTAVNRVSMAVEAGEVLCLLGPSGCGKTTTLRMIAGLETVSEGEVYLDGRLVNHLAARERNVAMAFQFYALYPSLDVADNLAYPLHADGLSAAAIGRRVREIAETLELTEVLHRRPNQLSEGEKQRVAVGRAIIRDPNCFLFDEPLSRLDVELRHSMRGQIKRVLSGLSKATVIVTHDQLEALTMADRIAVMRDGNIEQIATPHAIFATPANRFVAGFIGTPQMNLLDARVRERDEGTATLDMGGSSIVVAVDGQVPLDGNLTVGIRPRAFSIGNSGGVSAVHTVVELIEPMGAETLIHATGDHCEYRVVVRRGIRVRVGQPLALTAEDSQIHLFAADGARIERKAGG